MNTRRIRKVCCHCSFKDKGNSIMKTINKINISHTSISTQRSKASNLTVWNAPQWLSLWRKYLLPCLVCHHSHCNWNEVRRFAWLLCKRTHTHKLLHADTYFMTEKHKVTKKFWGWWKCFLNVLWRLLLSCLCAYAVYQIPLLWSLGYCKCS